jgi:hypothetical protein
MATGKATYLTARVTIVLLALTFALAPALVKARPSEPSLSADLVPALTGGCPNPYHVRPGETLNAIARTCGVSTRSIRQWNNLSSDKVGVGRALIVRVGGTTLDVLLQTRATPALQAVRSRPVPIVPQPTPCFVPTIAPLVARPNQAHTAS